MTAPLVLGIASIIFFSVVDTWFVSRLGEDALAAIGFTFPVTFFVMHVTMGLGIGVTAAIGQALGQGSDTDVRQLATQSLILGVIVVLALSALGLLTIDALFRLLGAPDHLLPLIRDYMMIWYAGVGMLVIPMLSNSVLRATGDTLSPALVMFAAGLVNVGLDPLLIFGAGPFPRLEMAGAALATVASWMIALIVALLLVGRRERLLTRHIEPLHHWPARWRQILRVGLPAAVTNVLIPIGNGVLTRILANAGTAAVAAFGVTMRIESLALAGMFAMATAMTAVTAQHFGANSVERLRAAFAFCVRETLVWGAIIAAVLWPLAGPLAGTFADSGRVAALIVHYLHRAPLTYGLFGMGIVAASMLNGLHRPMEAMALIVIRLFVAIVPAAWIGMQMGGAAGALSGIAVGYLVSGVVGTLWLGLRLRRMTHRSHVVT
ncbi:MAG: MATE family efflux transporter [Candidatus Dadabacteria bacterium]|nr:MAG: MATE family efflux transporter [Candidatus Dadabacteria bacterium]